MPERQRIQTLRFPKDPLAVLREAVVARVAVLHQRTPVNEASAAELADTRRFETRPLCCSRVQLLFLLVIPLGPIFGAIPTFASCPILIVVGAELLCLTGNPLTLTYVVDITYYSLYAAPL